MKLAEASRRLERAFEERSARRHAEALAELEPLLALDLPPAAALTLAGECLVLEGRSDEAEAYLRTAAALAPRDADALLELAHYLRGDTVIEELAKDPQLLRIVSRLELERRRWTIVEEWQDDLASIGVTSARHPDRIFYLSIYHREPGIASYSCEVRTRGLLDITTLHDGTAEYDDLPRLMERFLDDDDIAATPSTGNEP